MKLTTKYTYPAEGTANKRVYTKEALRKAFDDPDFKERCESYSIPVLTEGARAVGWATANVDENFEVTVEAEIYDKMLADILTKVYETTGCPAAILGGRGEIEYDPDTDMNIVTKFIPENVLLCSRPALKHETTIEEV